MKQATIEYENEAGGRRIAVLPSIDIAGDDPMVVLGGIIIALSDRVSALEAKLAPPQMLGVEMESAVLAMDTPPEGQLPVEEQLEMDLSR